ncbi:MAG: signal recognition particle receptor subunit alpha [Candidatus Aenigmarchaeota archaeon]|nr:signal recognition particle receptor subunit alpha [Candidatus Aenigmarchaeota archaeon]MCX8190705.1 signal recognition particle receptor subunit alpha [Candidatus Aenigmarchaeota archaeon]MDW8159954.1 signal recognition particle receptor subunit alpha [Candidatus Aenigmarchaeota archaeon]
MLEALSEKLKNAIRKLLGKSVVDEKAVEELLKELKIILIEADVDLGIVNNFIESVRKKLFKEKIPAGFTLRDYSIKIVYEELVKILGEKAYEINGKKIMLIGLFGSGKTTTAAKLANYLRKFGKVALVCLDYHRPAAPEQLKQLAEKINVKYLIGSDAYSVAKESLEKFKNFDFIVYDTAGRDALDENLASELKSLAEIIKPDEKLLVIPAEIGKVAKSQSEEFNKLVGITGIIVTKMDSSAKAGSAISACVATGAKVKFVCYGEKIDAIEKYDPKRFVSRILGLGDLETLIEKAKEVVKPEKTEKLIEGDFTLEDFIEQIESFQKIGPFDKIFSMIPGLSLPKDIIKKQEDTMKKWKYIIQSMTPKERKEPEIIDESRIKRIAKGSGTSEEEVRNLISQYFKVKKMMKSFGGMKGLSRGNLQNLLKQFGFRV